MSNTQLNINNGYLYRFINKDEFEKILINNTLVLKRPSLWKDQYEGFAFKLLDNQEGKKLIKSYFDSNNIQFFPDFLQILKDTIYCLCFTMTAEDDALWNSYNYNHQAIRLKIARINIESLLPNTTFFILKDVQYENKTTLHGDLNKYLSQIIYKVNGNTKVEPFKGYIVKREEFRHENEARLLFYNAQNLLAQRNDLDTKVYYVNGGKTQPGIQISDTYELKISQPITQFISSVLIHPEADETYLKLIESLCLKYGVTFAGKSNIYEIDKTTI
jgi:hypothetical protein